MSLPRPAAETAFRPVARVVRGMPASDGDGVRMTRMIGTPALRVADPFLMLDHFDSAEAADYMGGFPDHHHRGFETVTYMLEGRMRHGDNKGHSGVIGPGGVQWMRAGRGLVHSEMPEQQEGRMRGFQLWVNLPASLKMSEPAYQEFPAEAIPAETRDGGAVLKVIAGETSRGTRGPVVAATVDAVYADVALPAGAALEEPLPPGHLALLAVYEGTVRVGGTEVPAISTALLGEGEAVRVEAASADARFLLIAGRPLREPIVWAGPFVMNTEAEVHQAIADFRAGRF